MSEQGQESTLVTDTIRGLLPVINSGFDTTELTERYDANPERTAMSIHFTDADGERAIERIVLGLDDDLEVTILDGIPDGWRNIGAIVTYQDYGLRILDPDDDMTPQRARYQHAGVRIEPADGEHRERVWLVISSMLEVILESIIYKQQLDDDDVEADDEAQADETQQE